MLVKDISLFTGQSASAHFQGLMLSYANWQLHIQRTEMRAASIFSSDSGQEEEFKSQFPIMPNNSFLRFDHFPSVSRNEQEICNSNFCQSYCAKGRYRVMKIAFRGPNVAYIAEVLWH